MRDLIERTGSSASTSASCLALVAPATSNDKKRAGGCVGVFFQLFNWNSRFAKKKLFPKKLLPLAGAKQVSKKFIVDEKKKFIADEKFPKPKHLLIAEENTGGFPAMKKNFCNRSEPEEKKQEMRAAGLVARLMGLETLPAVSKRPKSDEGSIDASCDGKCESFFGDFGGGLDKEVSSYEKGSVGRTVMRPQKMQKTGLCERHQIARFGVDALQIMNAMPRSSKHDHKLAFPVKSPRVARSMSRLMGAATKILEPGLQATSRDKGAVKYPSSVVPSFRDEAMRETKTILELPDCGGSECSLSRGQSGRKHCGELLEDTDVKFVTEEHAPSFDLPSSSVKDDLLGLLEFNSRSVASVEKERGVVLLRSKHPQDYFPFHFDANPGSATESVIGSVGVAREGLDEQHSPTRTHSQDELCSIGSKKREEAPVQKEMLLPSFQPLTRMANEESRRLPSMACSLDDTTDNVSFYRRKNRPQVKAPYGIDNIYEAQRKYSMRAGESSSAPKSSARKRGSANAGNLGSAGLIIESHRGLKNRTVAGGRRPWLSSNSTDRSCARNGPISPEWKTTSRSKDMDVVSFSFSSPFRSKDENFCIPSMKESKRNKNDSVGVIAQSKLPSKANCGEKPPQSSSSLVMNQDALGALLDKKLKELTQQVEEESVTGVMSSTRTTAIILQELISALTAANPTSVQDQVIESPKQWKLGPDEDIADAAYQVKAPTDSPYLTVSTDGAHFSPGSVLEGPFSSESCISSSTNDASDAGILDSTSSSKVRSSLNSASVSAHPHNDISMVLQKADLATTSRLTEPKIDFMNGILQNLVVLFSDIGLSTVNRFMDFILGPFLDELETFPITTWMYHALLGCESTKGDKLFKGFLLDCVLECLDLRYGQFFNSGCEVWSRLLPLHMDSKLLVRAVNEEVMKCTGSAGKHADVIIELEMSTSLGKWTDFKIEEFEMGSEIGLDIVQTLVDEIVIELL
ncbi:hypothetical protein AKJ16_DCAP17010 [Drosera capensis]